MLGVARGVAGVGRGQPAPSALGTNQYSIELAGTNGYARIGAGGSVPSDMNVNPLSDSYSAFITAKVPASLSYQQCLFARAEAGSSNIGMFVAVNDSDGKPYAIIGGTTLSATSDVRGGWHQIGVVVGSGGFGIVVDGVIEATASTGSANSTFDYLIGGSRYNDNVGDSFVWIGQLQNFTWWTAKLNALDCSQLYNSGTPVDPTTHFRHAALAHWWSLGQGDSIPTLTDSVGAVNATLIHTYYARLTKTSPVFTPSSLAVLPETFSCDAHWVAEDWDGSGSTWTDRVSSFAAAKQSSPVKSSSLFSGRSKISNAGWWRAPNHASHLLGTSGKVSYVFLMYAGALNSTGGFYMGYDATVYGKSNVEIYNFGYVRDVGFRLRKDDNSGDYMAAEDGNATHANKYVMLGVTADLTVPRIRTYVLGGLLAEDTTTSGAYAVHTDAPWGMLGIAYSDAGGYVSTASGQELLEVVRYPGAELTPAQMATLMAEFNALKGYV